MTTARIRARTKTLPRNKPTPDETAHLVVDLQWSESLAKLVGAISELADLVPDWQGMDRDEILARIDTILSEGAKLEAT